MSIETSPKTTRGGTFAAPKGNENDTQFTRNSRSAIETVIGRGYRFLPRVTPTASPRSKRATTHSDEAAGGRSDGDLRALLREVADLIHERLPKGSS
jgi:hypothetical protein